MKRILYDTGRRTVARWPHKRLRSLRSSVMVKWPPPNQKIENNKFVLKCILGHFQCFEQLFFWVENRPIRPPPPLLVENFTNFFFLKPSLMHVILKKFLGHTNRKTDKVSYRSSFPELKKVQVISTSILSGLSWRRIFNPPPTQSPHFLRGGGWGGGRGVKILF